jgi:hypothetical protein
LILAVTETAAVTAAVSYALARRIACTGDENPETAPRGAMVNYARL